MKDSEIGFGAIYMWSVCVSLPLNSCSSTGISAGSTSTHSLITHRRCPGLELRPSSPIRSTYRPSFCSPLNKLLAERSKNCGTLNSSILDPLLIALLPFTATLWLVVFFCILVESLAAGLVQRTHNIINVCKHDKIGRPFL